MSHHHHYIFLSCCFEHIFVVREIGFTGWLVGFEANFWGLVKPIPHQLAMIKVSREIQRTCRFSPPWSTTSDPLHLLFIACFVFSLVAYVVVQRVLPTTILLGRALLRCFISEECLFPSVLMRRSEPFWSCRLSSSASAFVL